MKMQNALRLLVHRLPRAEQRERRQEAGQHEQQQADAVDADEVVDAERRNPGVALDELEVGGRRVEAAHSSSVSANTSSETTSAMLARDRRALLLVVAHEEQQDGAGDRQRDRAR